MDDDEFKNTPQKRHLEPAFWVRDLTNIDEGMYRVNNS